MLDRISAQPLQITNGLSTGLCLPPPPVRHVE